MGCSISGLGALYDAATGSGDVWIHRRRFRILRQLRDGGLSLAFLVRELPSHDGLPFLSESEDGMYALKKVFIQSAEQLELAKEEIHTTSLFRHANLLPLLDHSIIAVKSPQGEWYHEAYLLFPVHMDGNLYDLTKNMQANKEYFSPMYVLQIFRQICAGVEHMHSFDPPYCHNDIKPANILIKFRKGQTPLAMLMNFSCASPARREIHSRSEALLLQEWAAQHCSAPFRAPELWDCPSDAVIDDRTDIWSLGCTLYAIMYGKSPFEHAADDEGGLQAVMLNAHIPRPSDPQPPYPDSLHQFVSWMLQASPAGRPHINDVILHVDKLIEKYSS